MMLRTLAVIAVVAVVALPGAAEAKKHHGHRHGHGHYGFVCGKTQANYFSQFNSMFRDSKWNLARNWATLPHTSAQEGAVVVQSRSGMDSSGKHRGGHVSRIVKKLDACSAIVTDEKGTYKRNICANLIAYVKP